MNQIIRENSYSNQQPRMGNWGVGSSNNCSQPCSTNQGITTAPIAGWRKTLNCCESCVCTQKLGFDTSPPNPVLGAQISQTSSGASGIIIRIIPGGVEVKLDDCTTAFVAENLGATTLVIDPTTGPIGTALTVSPIGNELCNGQNRAEPLTTEIYKDTWTGCTGICPRDISGNAARTRKPIIRSGMQPNGKTYTWDKHQYLQNYSCKSFERNSEKHPIGIVGLGPPHSFKKSGCCRCCDDACFQVIEFTQTPDVPMPQVGETVTQAASGATGVVTSIDNSGPFPVITITTDDCETTPFLNGTGTGFDLVFSGGITVAEATNSFIISGATLSSDEPCGDNRGIHRLGADFVTWKPSNNKFKVQGGVSSSTRLERLKLNTIMGSRINKLNCDGDCSDNLEHGSRRSYMGGKPRFVTLGSHTAGFVPTRWRQAYLAHGRAIGNIFQRTSSYDAGGKTQSSLPYPIGSTRGFKTCCVNEPAN